MKKTHNKYKKSVNKQNKNKKNTNTDQEQTQTHNRNNDNNIYHTKPEKRNVKDQHGQNVAPNVCPLSSTCP